MNIVYLAPFAFSPKATVSARMLPMATALIRRGHRVTILMPPYDNPADLGRRWETAGVALENVAGGSFTLVSMARQLAARVREIRPDALHVFKPVGPGALAMWLLGAAAQRAVVDNDDWEGKGGWLDINPYPSYQKWVMAWQERWALQKARLITCASDTLAARSRELIHELQPSPFTAVKPIIVLPNGPDESLREDVRVAEAKRDALREQFGWAGQRIIIYAGTVPNGHDMDMAVQAVAAARGSTPLRWVIIATGDGLPSLHTSIHAAGLDDIVAWHGFMPHSQLVERLVAADVALYPYRDTNINRAKCSGKVIDYMACAKPMVVSDVGMNRVYLENGVSGLLTSPGDTDADEFSADLRFLLSHPTEAAQMGHAAQARLWSQFSWESRVAELERIYTASPFTLS